MRFRSALRRRRGEELYGPVNALEYSDQQGSGLHRFGIFAVNTAGQKWSGVVSASVK